MTANPLTQPADSIAVRGRELRELAERMPEPVLADVLADWRALYAATNAGELRAHLERFVAFYEGQLVGVGDEQLELRLRLARQFGLHPERFAITFNG